MPMDQSKTRLERVRDWYRDARLKLRLGLRTRIRVLTTNDVTLDHHHNNLAGVSQLCICLSVMGFCFSCCRRRKSSERQPLLAPNKDPLPPPKSLVEKAVDILAALKANKLPSQSQLNTFLQLTLRSDFLEVQGLPGYGPVSDDARKVILDLRECVDAILQIGMEKNGD